MRINLELLDHNILITETVIDEMRKEILNQFTVANGKLNKCKSQKEINELCDGLRNKINFLVTQDY